MMETEAVGEKNGLMYCQVKDELVLRYDKNVGQALARSIIIKPYM